MQRVVCLLDMVSVQSDGKGRDSDTGTLSLTAPALAFAPLAIVLLTRPLLTSCYRLALTRKKRVWMRIITENRRMPVKAAPLMLQVDIHQLRSMCCLPDLLILYMDLLKLPPDFSLRFPGPRKLDCQAVRRLCQRQCS